MVVNDIDWLNTLADELDKAVANSGNQHVQISDELCKIISDRLRDISKRIDTTGQTRL